MDTYLAHYGVLGMKWGVRRYQNKDGTLTDAGKNRTDSSNHKRLAKNQKKAETLTKKLSRGSSYDISGIAFQNLGYYRLADYYFRKSDKQRAQWQKQLDEVLKEIGDIPISKLK